MKTSPAPAYVLVLLLVIGFTLATWLQPIHAQLNVSRGRSEDLLSTVMGDGKRLFAGLFFRKADIYFHSGYYPSVFNHARTNEMHIAEQASADHPEPEEETEFLGPPQDWIEALNRYSINTEHSHLDETGKTAEILPWLKISAELDPQNVTTYIVAAFYLREMGKIDDALQFLRDGMRENPGSSEIRFELGRIFAENKNDPQRAITLYSLALNDWQQQEGGKEDPDYQLFDKIASRLALLEEKEGDYTNALRHMEIWHSHAIKPEPVQEQIDELKARMRKSAGGQ